MIKIDIPEGHTLVFKKTNLRKALRESATLVAREARQLTRNPDGGGRAYSTPRSMSKGVHYASAPGEPPATLTGELSKSITTKVSRSGDTVTIRDTAFYAKFLEVGAKGGGGNRTKGGKGRRNTKATRNKPGSASTSRVLAPRPFISRALDDHRSDIDKKIADAVEKDISLK